MKRAARALFLAAALFAAPAQAAEGKAYAVVVGIDDYKALPKLKGAVNDAQAIASALRENGAAEVVTLINEQATRARFEDAVRQMGARAAAAGGWLVVTYAGHGGQEAERLAGDEDDKLDEVLLFPGFQTSRGGNAERLPDNEVRTLFASLPSDLQILFVVDACHSGTMTRAADPRSVGITYRNGQYGAIEDDQLPPPSPATLHKEVNDLRNVLFVASALDSEKTPELEIEGQQHGAVSWHLAQALRGFADADGDKRTTLAELRQYLVVAPRALAQGRQTPGVFFFPGREDETFPLAPAASANRPVAVQHEVSLWSLGGDSVGAVGATAAASAADADLIWDPAKRQVVDNATGDMIAELSGNDDQSRFLAGVVDKQKALHVLLGTLGNDPLTLDLGPSGAGALYTGGAVSIEVPRRASPDLRYLTIFNIAGDGTVQALYPATPQEAAAIPADEPLSFGNKVRPPYGADHVVAIATTSAPSDLRALIAALDGQKAASQIASAVVAVQRAQRASVGILGLFTGPE